MSAAQPKKARTTGSFAAHPLLLHFYDPGTEADFRTFYQRMAMPFFRAGLVLASISWIAAVPFLAWQFPSVRSLLIPLSAVLGLLPALVLYGTYRRKTAARTPYYIAGLNAVAGLTVVFMRARVIEDDLIAVTALIILVFFACILFRLRLLFALTATATYLVAFDIFVMLAPYTFFERVTISFMIWLAEGSAIIGCFVLERSARDLFRQQQVIRAQRTEIRRERARSERLLYSILPVPIAQRIKQGDPLIADHFDEVTIMFTDIVGFTSIAEKLSAHELVQLLNEAFRAFDEIAERHQLEKIKTIGDAYMAVSGIPQPKSDHASRAVAAALQMVEWARTYVGPQSTKIQLRVGLHSGPVTAGVLGKNKYSYDLWGDTVNTAARMESHGEPDRVQLSARTRALLGNQYRTSSRGLLEVKGKGAMELFLVDG